MSSTEHDHNDEVALYQCLPEDETLDFDKALKRFSMFTGISDPNNESEIPRKTKIYNTIVLVFLYSNLLRTTIECFLPKGSPWFLYLGDFKPWWGEPYIAHQVVFYMAVLVVPAICTLNITADESLRRWCLPFRYMQGLICANEAKLWNIDCTKRLRRKMKFTYKKAFISMFSVHIPYTVCVLVTFAIFCPTWTDLFLLGVPWTVYESLWTVYITSNMGLLPGSFDVVCYYLRLRYEQIEEQLEELNKNYSNFTADNPLLAETKRRLDWLLKTFDDTNKDLLDYNKYWSRYTTIVFTSYIPQLLFELYILLFLEMNSSVMVFSTCLNLNMFALITQMAMFSAVLHKKANGVYNRLNSTVVRMSRAFMKSRTNRRVQALKQMLRMSMFIERYSSRLPLGISLLNMKLMDIDFYFNLCVEATVYFLLVTKVLKYSKVDCSSGVCYLLD